MIAERRKEEIMAMYTPYGAPPHLRVLFQQFLVPLLGLLALLLPLLRCFLGIACVIGRLEHLRKVNAYHHLGLNEPLRSPCTQLIKDKTLKARSTAASDWLHSPTTRAKRAT